MSMNLVIETSVSTGTGNFTLDGAFNDPDNYNGGNRTIIVGVEKINHQFVYMIRDKLNNWEKGWGYLSASNTLVRYTVLDNSIGVGNRTKVNFPAGPKLVYLPNEAKGVGAGAVNTLNFVMSPHNVGIKGGNLTVAINRLYLTPYVFDTPMRINAIAQYIRNTVGGATARIGLYNANKQLSERPGAAGYDTFYTRLVDLGTVDVSSPGLKALSCNELVLKGVYFVGSVYSGAVSVMANTTNNIDVGLSWNNYEGNALSYLFHDSSTHINGLPEITFGAMSGIMNAGGPAMLIRGDNL
jgi:hypothetical protein